eukprot:TRINITY_DN4787_c0_g1_i1.p1 TRINITY_DN4787_c0_g1~~TRINITY_DN4787_c0_g1_i1.p1  ORF type:complete len:387 (-),score=108.36 TRINITY_DN4787_c0_g1_i1:885-2045(-)
MSKKLLKARCLPNTSDPKPLSVVGPLRIKRPNIPGAHEIGKGGDSSSSSSESEEEEEMSSNPSIGDGGTWEYNPLFNRGPNKSAGFRSIFDCLPSSSPSLLQNKNGGHFDSFSKALSSYNNNINDDKINNCDTLKTPQPQTLLSHLNILNQLPKEPLPSSILSSRMGGVGLQSDSSHYEGKHSSSVVIKSPPPTRIKRKWSPCEEEEDSLGLPPPAPRKPKLLAKKKKKKEGDTPRHTVLDVNKEESVSSPDSSSQPPPSKKTKLVVAVPKKKEDNLLPENCKFSRYEIVNTPKDTFSKLLDKMPSDDRLVLKDTRRKGKNREAARRARDRRILQYDQLVKQKDVAQKARNTKQQELRKLEDECRSWGQLVDSINYNVRVLECKMK